MIVIEVKQDRGDPPISIVTFAKSEEEIRPRSIRAVSSTMSTSAESLSFVEDRSGEYDDAETGYTGQILDSRPGQYGYNVFAWPEDQIEEVIVSGMFVNVYTTEELKRLRPHTVFVKSEKRAKDFLFPSLYGAIMFAEQYEAELARSTDTITIENEDGQTVN